ncbi:MAG: 23S rRNA (uracil(1939)-C(5))-methyltransferase RlmD [Candidatus Hydrogenedentes bacterium]|nr:23S rRNA (uracil(1939)-C(5))-methyltransferase RlmD [Candidatus Hydrogenedentota bacterium]
MSTVGQICKHFGYCGGCTYQHLPYEEQLQHKKLYISQLFVNKIPHPIPILPSPEIWHYRNKIDPVFALEYFDSPPHPNTPRKTVLGYKKNKKWYATFQLEECLIGPEEVPDLIEILQGWRNEHGYEAYDRRSGKGVLKAVLFRKAKKTNEKMVCVITRDLNLKWDSLVKELSEKLACKSVYAGLLTRPVELSLAERWELLYGTTCITETLTMNYRNGNKTWLFNISPSSFFQTNTLGAEMMFQKIYDWAKELQPDVIYDLYGGMGTIGILLSPIAEKIYSVDNVQSAVEDGYKNLEKNRISNICFTLNSVKRFLLEKLEHKTPKLGLNELVVLDPPREGLTPKVIRKLLEWKPKNIIYVSCNPKILSQEISNFLEYYSVTDSISFDLFPHTPHFELLTIFTLK